MCLTLCACGDGGVQLTTDEVEAAFDDVDGTLDMKTSGKYVRSFTYTVDELDTKNLSDAAYCKTAIYNILSGDTSKITGGQVKVSRAFTPVFCAATLFGQDESFDASTFIESVLSIVCDGKTVDYDELELWQQVTFERKQSDSIKGIRFLNERFCFSAAVYRKMMETTALMGRQSEENGKYRVSWSYHPSRGLEVMYEKK